MSEIICRIKKLVPSLDCSLCKDGTVQCSPNQVKIDKANATTAAKRDTKASPPQIYGRRSPGTHSIEDDPLHVEGTIHPQ